MPDLVPDYCEPLVGYRIWRVARDTAGRPYLQSRNNSGELWLPRQAAAARCRYTGPRLDNVSHQAPDLVCTCGLYAWKPDAPGVRTEPVGLAEVVGQVWLWGRIVEQEHGYRAQYAYPKALWIQSGSPDEWAHYGVPVEVRPCISAPPSVPLPSNPSNSPNLSAGILQYQQLCLTSLDLSRRILPPRPTPAPPSGSPPSYSLEALSLTLGQSQSYRDFCAKYLEYKEAAARQDRACLLSWWRRVFRWPEGLVFK